MKMLVFILLILSAFNSFAQKYDLIVTLNGDSIACNIDSITDSQIHFEMKMNDRWLHTNTYLTNINEYKEDVYAPHELIFKPSTSYIQHVKKIKVKKYDVITLLNGDSIACNIDSITESRIYFEMKVNDHWTHTNIKINEISKYKEDVYLTNELLFKTGTSYIIGKKEVIDYFDRSIYSNRYLFAPSAFATKKNLFSYSNITLGLHDCQYGISDNFSVGFGTTMLLFPSYIMSVYSIPINKNSAFAIGDLLMFSPYPDDLSFFGNLFYGMYTKGSDENNFSIGLGLWTTTNSDIAAETVSPAINFSAMLKTEYNCYFIPEEYAFQYNTHEIADYLENGVNFLYEEEFKIAKYVIGGISGFRVIGKNYPKNSWQFALAYIFIISGDPPNKYQQPNWVYNGEEKKNSFVPWPIISYTRRF